MIRVLEVLEMIGYSIMVFKEELKWLYDYFMIGLDMKCDILYDWINYRVDLMLVEGLVVEVCKVYEFGEV